jgi:hypothetical protein
MEAGIRPTVVPTTLAGEPKLLTAQVRKSESMPGRLKVGFTIEKAGGIAARVPDGSIVPSVEEIPADAPDDLPVALEFRIEMN